MMILVFASLFVAVSAVLEDFNLLEAYSRIQLIVDKYNENFDQFLDATSGIYRSGPLASNHILSPNDIQQQKCNIL